MFLSVFDIFKIGIGPSSSHTMGPMTAAGLFLAGLKEGDGGRFALESLASVRVHLHGSLAFTGKGHATDRAVFLGLMGFEPSTLDPDKAEAALAELFKTSTIEPPGLSKIAFDPDKDLVFDFGPALPLHANGLSFTALDAEGSELAREVYYSVGGGFVVREAELLAAQDKTAARPEQEAATGYPFPFRLAAEMLEMGEKHGLSIAEMKRANEETDLGGAEIDRRITAIWSAMNACVSRGLAREGELPGGLKVKRRAKAIQDNLLARERANDTLPHAANDWLSLYAMAVNEENAAGGRVVTSPTNGAAGVVPAVIRYYLDHCRGNEAAIETFLLTASAIGGLIKHNASISGAECGCQAEIGSASAMAAAGLCAVLGGSNAQIENAAEIALEHHLGLTCDPVKGLVQVPCIERNGLGAIKAVASASLALHGDGTHFMPLDNCIETLRQTGIDMGMKYKETSLGGLAVNHPEC